MLAIEVGDLRELRCLHDYVGMTLPRAKLERCGAGEFPRGTPLPVEDNAACKIAGI